MGLSKHKQNMQFVYTDIFLWTYNMYIEYSYAKPCTLIQSQSSQWQVLNRLDWILNHNYIKAVTISQEFKEVVVAF